MKKLFNLKEWLTVPDAARYLALSFGEEVAEADILRLALDGRLKLSVYFVNYAQARRGKVVPWEETEWFLFQNSDHLPGGKLFKGTPKESTDERPRPPKLADLFKDIPVAERCNYIAIMKCLMIDDARYLNLSKEVSTLQGVWDLPMIGNERLDVEHEYQLLTSGPPVTLQGLDGAFVEGPDGEICQLQESFKNNPYASTPAPALLELEKQLLKEIPLTEGDAKALLNQQMERRKKLAEHRRAHPAREQYYPAGGLPDDCVLVVRTSALRAFESAGNDEPSAESRDHVSDKLALMNQAAQRFWGNADRADRSTHTENAKVIQWLENHGFSTTLAGSAATIIRPDWAPPGRKPEK